MPSEGVALIFHSDEYDRVHHGLSIALANLAMGRSVKLFFSYWALEYLKKGYSKADQIPNGEDRKRKILEKNLKEGHISKIGDSLGEIKRMGGKIYVCTSSMGLVNIVRSEIIDEVDRSMGITTFFAETAGFQILFI